MKKIQFRGNKNIIHRRLLEWREKRGLTQGELAARMQVLGVNLDQQMVSRIEHNDRIVTDYELFCFCKVLKITERELLEDLSLEDLDGPHG